MPNGIQGYHWVLQGYPGRSGISRPASGISRIIAERPSERERVGGDRARSESGAAYIAFDPTTTRSPAAVAWADRWPRGPGRAGKRPARVERLSSVTPQARRPPPLGDGPPGRNPSKAGA